MPALRAVGAYRVLALSILFSSVSVVIGIKLLHVMRSEEDSAQFRALRARANSLFAQKNYSAAAVLYRQGYLEATSRHKSLSALRFLNNLGATQFAQMHYREAIDSFAKARDLARVTGDRGTLSAACANLCSMYGQIGDLEAAAAAAEQGIEIPSDSNLPYRSQLLVALGLLSSRTGNSTNALHYFRDAIDEAEKHASDAQRFEAWSNYAGELLNSNRSDEAEVAALEAWRLGHLKTVRELRPALVILARIYRARGDFRTAASLIDVGLSIPARGSDHRLWKRHFLYERACVRNALGNSAGAADDLRGALILARRWRESVASTDTLRSGAEAPLREVYASFIQTAAAIHSPVEAFLAAEEERSASLVQMLRDGSATTDDHRSASKTLPSEYWEALARLRSAEIARIASPKTYDSKSVAQTRARLAELEAQAGGNFFSSPQEKDENIPSSNTLHGVAQKIAPGEALLSLYSGKNASFLWALTRTGLEMHRLAPAERLTSLAQRFHRAIEQNAADRDQLASGLYQELFGALSKTVLAKQSWIVTSDDSLFDIPLEALVVEPRAGNRRPTYLVERHETHRIPSAFMLGDSFNAPAEGPFLAIGDGIYNAADERWRKLHPATTLASVLPSFGAKPANVPLELPRLVSSSQELQGSAASWPSTHAPIILTGPNATRERFLPSLAENPAVIHIASHVLYPSGNPTQAFIDLGINPSGATEALTARDITTLRAPGALVVMSGCSSAAATALRGSGITGLSRAWLLAGARAVVGSRWPVQDGTGDLFHAFYSHLAASSDLNRGLGSALQQAQLQMLRSDNWRSNPRYWGAFYLMTKN